MGRAEDAATEAKRWEEFAASLEAKQRARRARWCRWAAIGGVAVLATAAFVSWAAYHRTVVVEARVIAHERASCGTWVTVEADGWRLMAMIGPAELGSWEGRSGTVRVFADPPLRLGQPLATLALDDGRTLDLQRAHDTTDC